MDEGQDDVEMDREDSGGAGAGSSREWRAVREGGVDVEAAVERATRAAGAAQWEQFGGEPAGVKKQRNRGKRAGSRRRRNEARARAAGQEQPSGARD